MASAKKKTPTSTPKKSKKPPTITQALGPKGLLSKEFDRYEMRPPQLEMANHVLEAIAKEESLIVEAATGTGKTLAYLIPALISGKRVVVSTGTKALQEQLFYKDIPLLKKIWPQPVQAILIKGRRNYLCKLRFEQMLFSPSFRRPQDEAHWEAIRGWAGVTNTGDRAEIDGLPDDYPSWADLSVGSEACLGNKCKHYDTCHVVELRRKAAEAKIYVVNHHLFFADLAVRHGGRSDIIPPYDAVVFDEAHHLEQVASSYFGTQVSNATLAEILQDTRTALQTEGLHTPEIERALRTVSQSGTGLFTLISFQLKEGRYPIAAATDGLQGERIAESRRQFGVALTELERDLKAFSGAKELSEKLARRVAQLKFDTEALLQAADERFTYFMEIRDRGVYLQASPIDLAHLFRERVLRKNPSLIYTSATLATGGKFDYFKRRLGIGMEDQEDEEAHQESSASQESFEDREGARRSPIKPPKELHLEVVFDYKAQSLLYVPRRMPAPNHPEFRQGATQVIEYLVNMTKGHAFVLFTSWANMNAVHEELRPRLKMTVLKQGERPKRELIDLFKEDQTSVLFATSSFWEGVDIEGNALQLVILDKLPFASPGDPLVRARMDWLKAQGRDSFRELSMPSAALMLKQGFGRLIRSKQDKGIVAILDSRIATKSYGDYFIKSLPPAPMVWNASEVKSWWQAHQAEDE